MMTEMNENMVETTVEAVETAIENVAATSGNGSLLKAAGIVGGAALVGYGIYKTAKFIKAKVKAKKANKQQSTETNIVEPDFKGESEESEK